MGNFRFAQASVPIWVRSVSLGGNGLATVCISCLLACSIALAREPIKVFLLVGQSNMVGLTSSIGLPSEYKAQQSRVMIFGDGEIDGNRKRKWMPNGEDFGHSIGWFGPELLFGKTLSDSMPGNRIALIKYSVGGTSLASDWRPPSSGGRVGSLYKNMAATVQAGIESLDSQYSPQWAGILWMQGEYDSGNKSYAEEYESNLTNLIHDMRGLLKDNQIPFMIGMVDSSRYWSHVGTVRDAERKVARRINHIGLFDTRGFDTDGTHYKKDGMIALGRNFALTYLTGFSESLATETPGRFMLSSPSTSKRIAFSKDMGHPSLFHIMRGTEAFRINGCRASISLTP